MLMLQSRGEVFISLSGENLSLYFILFFLCSIIFTACGWAFFSRCLFPSGYVQ